MQISSTNFVKVGHQILNTIQITHVDLEYYEDDPSESRGVSVDFSDGEKAVFWDAEAAILRKYFLSGSRTYDLENIYGEKQPA